MSREVRGRVVHCDDALAVRGTAGVLVSDGLAVVRTDELGHFVLTTGQTEPLLFVCVPSGFRSVGPFFRRVQHLEQLDFQLERYGESTQTDFSFAILADYQWEPDSTLCRVMDGIMADPVRPAFVVHLGDLFYMMEGAPVKVARHYYQQYHNMTSELTYQVFNLIGNHDQVNGPAVSGDEPGFGNGLYREHLGPTYYAFEWGQLHFVVLNPFEIVDRVQRSRICAVQLEWLRNHLQLQPREKPIVLLSHRAPSQLENEDALLQILNKHRVLACFAGDWHRDAVYRCPGEPFTTVVTVGPFENLLALPPGYRIAEVRGSSLSHTYRLLHSLDELHIVRPAPGSQVGSVVDLVVTEHVASSRAAAPAWSFDSATWTPLQAEPLPLQRTAGCETQWARWRSQVTLEGHRTLHLRAADDSEPSSWLDLALRTAPSPVRWRREVAQRGDMAWRCHPIVAGNRVLLGEQDRIRAFRIEDGTEIWRLDEPGRWLATPNHSAGQAIFCCWEGTVLAVSVADGIVRWRTRQRLAIPPSQPAASVDAVVVGGMKSEGIWDGSLTCIDFHTGKVRWSIEHDHPYFATPLASSDRIWAAAGNKVQCLRAADGAELWSYWPEHFSLYGNMVLAQGLLFAPDIDGWTYVLDPCTGTLVNRFLLPRGVGLVSDRKRIFAACGVRGLCAVDPNSLEELWRVGRPGTYIAGRPTLRHDDLLVASSDGNVYNIAKDSGRVLWSYQLGSVQGSNVALGGDLGFLITEDAELVAFSCPAGAGA